MLLDRGYAMYEPRTTTRDDVLRAAIELFRDRPYDEVSVRKICDAAHVTRNSFYYYFETKSSIFDAIGDWCIRSSREKSLRALPADSSYQRLWAFYYAYLSTQLHLGPKIMNRVCTSRTERLRSDYQGFIDEELADVLSELIANAQNKKEIRNSMDPRDLLWTSYAVIRGVNIKWCFQWGQSDLLQESMEALDTLFLPTKGNALARERASANQAKRFSF